MMTDILPASAETGVRGPRAAMLLGAAIGATLLLGACVTKGDKGPTTQGWTRAEQLAWYHGDQGSRLIPHAWLMALEEQNSQAKFFTFDRMASLGYLPPDPDDAYGLKHGLPIGFALATKGDDGLVRSALRWKSGQGSKEPWVGMNCAACHTNDIRLGDKWCGSRADPA